MSAYLRTTVFALATVVGIFSIASADDVYQKPSDFINEVFDGSPPEAGALMIFGEAEKSRRKDSRS